MVFSEHSDIGTVIPYKRNILVDAIRHLETEANFRPFEAASRFFIIDDADKMNAEASNALLKTLEEPPASSHIFLITSRPDALLPTIRSRVQTLRFAPIETEKIKEHLLSTKQFSQPDAEMLAKLAHGRLGSALELDLEKFRTRRELMFKVLQSLLQTNDRAVLLQTAEEMNDAKNKDDYEKHLDALQTLIHDIWTLKLGGAEIVNADLKNHLERVCRKRRQQKTFRLADRNRTDARTLCRQYQQKNCDRRTFYANGWLASKKISIQIQLIRLKSFHKFSRDILYENQIFSGIFYLFTYFFRSERTKQTHFSRRCADT